MLRLTLLIYLFPWRQHLFWYHFVHVIVHDSRELKGLVGIVTFPVRWPHLDGAELIGDLITEVGVGSVLWVKPHCLLMNILNKHSDIISQGWSIQRTKHDLMLRLMRTGWYLWIRRDLVYYSNNVVQAQPPLRFNCGQLVPEIELHQWWTMIWLP